MARIEWGKAPRPYTTGIDRGVLYPIGAAVAWNGLISIAEKVSDSKTVVYLDGQKIQHQPLTENYAVTLDAFTYPSEFEIYDGVDGFAMGQQLPRFGLSYRVRHGEGYRIHLVYNALAIATDKTWQTLSDSPTASLFSWDVYTLPNAYPEILPSAHVIVDTNVALPGTIAALEDKLYGTGIENPVMPSIEDLVDLFEANAEFIVVDHGDGTWTATGSDEQIQVHGDWTFDITVPTAIYISMTEYTLSSA